jgi:hypothetical protein
MHALRPSRLIALALALLVGLAMAPAARAEETEIFLSWHAPWGYPGATDTLTADCDTTRADTLWLSFRPDKAHPTFVAWEATLLFHPAPGESLSAWWYDDGGGQGTPVHLGMQFHPQPGLGYPQPFRDNGAGGSRWDRLGEVARLRLVYATPYTSAISIDRKVYALARVEIRHSAGFESACRAPVCIEWTDSRLSYYVGNEFEKVGKGTHRFLSLNSPGGAITIPYRRALGAWKPKR